ncbi:MAG: DEAD/DEAH box helicase [Candidatus Altiarchaeales archaeon]|nr:DEAD/DEAH box helicase [Candidatus Altiarchaeales archaeon]MBD3416960.1 DEAD/DEAH box helicase [Candidatus Altiarchaeales archaeon]
MLVEDLQVAGEFRDMLKGIGVSELYPPQKLSVEAGAMEGRNIILCTPTASGKTIAAELAMMKALEKGRKVVYIVPLRALAYEKSMEFRKYERLGYRVKLEVGDLDSSKYKKAPEFDIIVATAEKCDSILRSKPEWFKGTGCVVFDEIHLIASDRGPVYEVLCSRFRNLYPDVQVLGLSATIGNADELGDWLNAEVVMSEWRPVDLTEMVVVKSDEDLVSVVRNALKGGQAMVFVNSRRSAEAVAERLGIALKLEVDNTGLAGEIESAINPPTRQCSRLASCAVKGTAFHHAGLVNKQRAAVEEAFKKGDIKVIAATPTLAAGVNLPSRTVVLRDVKRYTNTGMDYIDVLEYKQMVGRAGRPRYDDRGIAITMAKDEDEAEYIEEHYIHGKPEHIYSQLGVHPVLRFHTLASIASGFTRTQDALIEFIRSTFFGHQYGVKADLEALLRQVAGELIEWNFIREEGRFLHPTELGKRVSELYIDPLTAHNYLDLFKTAEDEERMEPLGLLEIMCDAVEITKLPIRSKEESKLWEKAYEVEDQLVRDLGGFGLDYDFLNRFKTALLFEDWIGEKTEDEILEEYGVAPGQLNMRLQNMEWLCYAAAELTRLTDLRRAQVRLKKLETRIKYGVQEDLVPLVSIKGIGRVRARKLYRAGIKTVLQVKKTHEDELGKIIGKKVARNIKESL